MFVVLLEGGFINDSPKDVRHDTTCLWFIQVSRSRCGKPTQQKDISGCPYPTALQNQSIICVMKKEKQNKENTYWREKTDILPLF